MRPNVELVVAPDLAGDAGWYWAVKIEGGIYADGEAENRMVAQSRCSDAYEEWKAANV